MAKTIKDMTYNSLLKENVRSTESDYSRGYLKGYKKGANAVLDELKTRLKEYKTNSLGEYFVAWDYINEIINELKGE